MTEQSRYQLVTCEGRLFPKPAVVLISKAGNFLVVSNGGCILVKQKSPVLTLAVLKTTG